MKVKFNSSQCGTIKDCLTGKTKEEVKQIKKIIKPCICGSQKLLLTEYETMGDTDYVIECMKCKKKLCRGQYDYDITKFEDILDFLIRDWNNGITQLDLDNAKLREYKRKTLTLEDLTWKKLYPNNMPCNRLSGIYCLLFKKTEEGIYACKWTIKFQKEEIEPMSQKEDAKTEAYILFMKRYFEVKGNLYYPTPDDRFDTTNTNDTFYSSDVNSYGDFIRSYKTLEEAKIGAVARCGWQGLNKDTVLDVKETM